MSRRFFKLLLLFGLLHYFVVLCLAGILFLISHIPPKAVNLDVVILALFNVESVLTGPRKLLLRFWPGESTPGWLSFTSTVANSFLWGTALATLKIVWRKVTT